MVIMTREIPDQQCSFCSKLAIGYETFGNGGGFVCEDHGSKELLSMNPGEIFDEKHGMLSWEFLFKTGKLVPEYHHRFGGVPKPEPKIIEGFWTLDDCADVLMVHREDVRKLIRKNYLKAKDEDGITYIQYSLFHEYIECKCKWGILLPLFWKKCKEE
jgi:hypothetical protein